jgi:hypothetical protein
LISHQLVLGLCAFPNHKNTGIRAVDLDQRASIRDSVPSARILLGFRRFRFQLTEINDAVPRTG